MIPHDFYILSKDGKYVRGISMPDYTLVDDVLQALPFDRKRAVMIAKLLGLEVEHFEVEIHIVSKGIVEVE